MSYKKVLKPAIRMDNGKIKTAPSWKYSHESIKVDGEVPKGKKGFILSDGDFVGRKKAAKIALAAGEIKKPVKKLHSHDLRQGAGIKKKVMK